jgi:lipopolysaccharide export system protein LptC
LSAKRLHATWGIRLRDTVSAYLPLMLMFLLALATWWLARHAPQPVAPTEGGAPRHEPDYAMRGVLLQRFDADGSIRVEVVGDALRHFPDDDRIEIDNARIRTLGRDARETVATARQALTTSKADDVRLQGGARVRSDAVQSDEQPVDFTSEFLHVLVDARRVRTHLPVTLRVGASEVRAAGLEYSEDPRLLELRGPLRTVLEPTLRPARKAR